MPACPLAEIAVRCGARKKSHRPMGRRDFFAYISLLGERLFQRLELITQLVR